MTNRILVSHAAFAVALSAAGFAYADGQATFYGWANFGGGDLTVTDSSRDFSISGAPPESAMIRSGNWEICTRPDFLGRCTVIAPGEYPKIGEQFGHIASAREISTIPDGERDYRRYLGERRGRR